MTAWRVLLKVRVNLSIISPDVKEQNFFVDTSIYKQSNVQRLQVI